MKSTWRYLFRRLAAGGLATSATAWSSALCYAQLAADYATDPVYADGWQGTTTNNNSGVVETTGDNGGFGFEPWNFDTDWLFNPDPTDGIQAIDDGLQTGGGNANSSTYNDLGKAWRIALPPDGLPRAGRGFAPLEVGQTIRVVFDNPTERQFFKGYFVRFNTRSGVTTGGGNICYDFPGYSTACTAADLNGDGNNVPLGADPKPKLTLQRFEYVDDGQWGVVNQADGDPDSEFHHIPLFDTDTAAGGVQLDLTITGPDTYQLTIDPLGAGETYTETGNLLTPGQPIDWIEFTFFNTPTNASAATDFYIKSLEIFGPAPPGVPGDYNNDGTVNAADYVIYRKHAGTAFQLENEVSGVTPGMVTPEDYTAWAARFGNTSGAGAGGNLAAVPEPGAIGLAVLSAGVWLMLFRRLQ